MALEDDLAELHHASWGWALACCRRDRVLAEDVLSDVYFRVLDGRARFAGQAAFKTWLFGVIRMVAREHGRWTRLRFLRGRDDVSPADLAARERSPDSSLAARQRAAAVSAALARLPGRQREVLHLVFYEDLSIREAAAVMGVSLGTARLHYERGKHAVSALLADQGAPPR